MTATQYATIAAMAAVTFAIRYLFFALGERLRFPSLVQRALTYVPIAVLTAIVVPMVLLPDGEHWQLSWRNPWLVGAAVSAIIAWRSNRLLAAIAAGMAVFLAWSWLFRG